MKNKRFILLISLLPGLLLCPPKKSKGCTAEELALLAAFESQVKKPKKNHVVQVRHEPVHEKGGLNHKSIKEAKEAFELLEELTGLKNLSKKALRPSMTDRGCARFQQTLNDVRHFEDV